MSFILDGNRNLLNFKQSFIDLFTKPIIGQEIEGGTIFYDRGEEYGDYSIIGNRLIRIESTVDDASINSSNWRFLICKKEDLNGNNSDTSSANKAWDWYGSSASASDYQKLNNIDESECRKVGAGLYNTRIILSKIKEINSNNFDNTLWKEVENNRYIQSHYQNETWNRYWFVPSSEEMILLRNSGIGNLSKNRNYWTSSEHLLDSYWSHVWTINNTDEYTGGYSGQQPYGKGSLNCRVRLIKRI